MQNNIFSIPEAAKYSAVSRWTIWKYVRSGELKASRTPGGHYRILKAELEQFMHKKGMYPMSTNDFPYKRILIVDDEPPIQNLIKKMLSRDRYEIKAASDGFEAGTKILQFKPELVILDLLMPGMDGFEVCKMIKKNPETSHIKILIITGHDFEENKTRIMDAGADGYIAKPFDKEMLKKNIENILNINTIGNDF